MDLQSPRSLQGLCFKFLAAKTHILWSWKDGSQLSEPAGVEWRDSQLFLHSQFADRLLEFLNYNETLNDGILSTFTQEHVRLKNVKISHSYFITEVGLQVLSHHKLISLDIICPLRMNICDLLKCIGEKSYESLQHLVLRRFRPIWPCYDLPGLSVIETLSRFNCLKSVDVSDTDLSSTMWTILGKSLLHLENLNLSRNDRITDISPLENCQKTLKSLSLRELPKMTESAMATFVMLTGLTYLDVSLVTGSGTFFNNYKEYDSINHRLGLNVFTADMLLQMPDVLPNLVCLDLSGRTVRSEHALSQFLDAHPSLQTLVLWGSAACQFKSLQDYKTRLTVGGDATLEQYAAVLRHCTRNDKHKEVAVCGSLQGFIICKLIAHLQKNQFPPSGDDHLFQVVLGMLPTRPSLFRDSSECYLVHVCLETISLLLEKRIVRHVDPDAKKHLLQFCHRAVQEHLECEVQDFAVGVINVLG